MKSRKEETTLERLNRLEEEMYEPEEPMPRGFYILIALYFGSPFIAMFIYYVFIV